VKIYTKTGDSGETGLFDGERVRKSDQRVDAYGEVDEAGAWLGVVRAHQPGDDIAAMLVTIQRDLFAIGAVLADPRHRIAARVEKAAVTADAVAQLEA
jgi:cob(I)alamin adenosyltransferase